MALVVLLGGATAASACGATIDVKPYSCPNPINLKSHGVVTVAVDGAMNAAILATQMMATGDEELMQKLVDYKESLKKKIVQANKDLSEVKYKFKTN